MKTLPGYQLSECLYSGTRTEVYRATRKSDRASVIIKILRNPHPNFSQLVQFRKQYAIARHLQHPNILTPLALERYGNGYALIMPDSSAIALHDYWQEFSPNPEEFLEIALQLTDALHYLSQEKIIHKDIKPANILIQRSSKQIKLIDFSISSLLPKETQTIQTANVLEGTLAYLSPEQTGRMNRGIDYRTDFYALGVTFYELLTGTVPFASNDPLELIHAHIAQSPPPPQVSTPLREIVLKLMAKNAEDRYQSALGLRYDLEKCLTQYKETKEIVPFVLGERDLCDRFLIPEQLYGREAETQQLLAAFERVAEGKTELILVAGFSGIGKTAVVNEVHKPIVREKGYFIKGKFDQFNRNIPLSALVQALRNLMAQILSESDTQIQQWKDKILEAVGENGQVIIDVIPDLEKIIGQQPAVPELSGSAAQNRFNLLFGKFIQVFASQEHPLVIFLDDLQWADSASLNLMKLLMSEASHSYLLTIGAYRDNEVFPAHPFMLTLDEMAKAQATINTITLAPLSEGNINRLVADTLSCDEEVAKPLTELVYQKTKGNPFFTTQFLLGLHGDKLIRFNSELGYWECDIAEVRQRALTDDVVEFMAGRLQKLPMETQAVLKLAACIGNQFDLMTLAIVCEREQGNTATALWKALQESFILPQSEVYKFYLNSDDASSNAQEAETARYRFLHDRVQQAAYSLIPDHRKQMHHYQIGKLLLQNISSDKWEENIFDIVNQLNQGAELIEIQEERERLAELNLMAGKKALAATAYGAATKYLEMGTRFLSVNSWKSQYNLTLSIYESAIEAEYLNINFRGAQTLANIVLEEVTSVLDRVKIYELQIQMYMAQSEMPKALEIGLSALELLGVDLNHTPASSTIALPKLSAIESLPAIQDAHQIAVMEILMTIFAPAYTTKPELLSPIVLTMIDMSLKQGHTSLTAFAYVFYGLMLCGFEKNLEKGYYSGLLALKVLDRFSARELECRVKNLFNVFIRPWKESLINTIEPLERASQVGFETGDIEYASYATAHRCTYGVLAGELLTEVQEKQKISLEILKRIEQDHSLNHAKIWQQFVGNLLQDVSDPKKLSGDFFDETDLLPVFCAGNDRSLPFTVYLAKSILSYLFGDYSVTVTLAVEAAKYADASIGITAAIHNFYYSLGLLSKHIGLPASKETCTVPVDSNSPSVLEQVELNQKSMKDWAVLAPQNFEHKYDLIQAETNRVLEQKLAAIELYDKAIAGAKENGYIQEEALANELAAKFYLDWGKEKVAASYMTDAYYCYARWGAKAKTEDLEKRYPDLLRPILKQAAQTLDPLETLSTLAENSITSTHSSTTSINSTLDLATVLKASQAISGIIDLDELMRQLTHIILQHSGGDRCALMLPNSEGQWYVQAIATPEETAICSQPLENNPNVPIKLIQYVKNTQETVVVNDLETDLPVIGNYLLQKSPKSLLCLPILNQGHLIGILYLKNLLVSGAFTKERVLVLNFLCTQAAISLENARLYEQSQAYARELEQSQLQIVQYEKMASLGNLMAGVAHEINNPLGFLNGSIGNLQENLHEILEHFQLYPKYYPEPVNAIEENAEEIDLDYLCEDMPKLLKSMENATERIKNISTSLRTFSRSDTEHKVSADIHQGIDSTLMILKYRLKANQQRPGIEVIKDYGEFSEVECFPGQLNQVFMNIIANGIDVFDEVARDLSYSDLEAHPQRLTIKTALRTKKNVVTIAIADNGTGMPPEVKERIFDHLFTTKCVGKGTGLGLAIVRQIVVEKHGGTIDCISELGKGTKFIITLPLS